MKAIVTSAVTRSLCRRGAEQALDAINPGGEYLHRMAAAGRQVRPDEAQQLGHSRDRIFANALQNSEAGVRT